MQEKRFTGIDGQEKVAYDFTRAEFTLLINSLKNYGHAGKRVMIRTNDPKLRMRPRSVERTEAVEKIHELKLEGTVHSPEASDMEALRSDRAEIVHAVKDPRSGLERSQGVVTLGLYTATVVFNELAQPVNDNAPGLDHVERIRHMMDQFHTDREQRLKEFVQENGF